LQEKPALICSPEEISQRLALEGLNYFPLRIKSFETKNESLPGEHLNLPDFR
jgi:hypothetical protein